MSRVGKQLISIPEGVNVSFDEGTRVVSVSGPKGTLTREIHRDILLEKNEDGIRFTPRRNTITTRALWGTYASHVLNMVRGVTKPYEKKLVVEGVGFKWEVAGDNINLSLGFSHPVKVPIPQGISASAEKNVLTIQGIDKELVGRFAAEIRSLKKPEPYKGKGIRYEDEVIRRKQGKKTA